MKKEGFKHRGEIRLDADGGGYMIELQDPDGGHSSHISAAILQSGAQGADEILDEVGDAERAEAPECEAADHGVVVAAVLLEEIDGEEGEIGVPLGVVADVEVAHLLEDYVGGGGAHDHLAEEGGDVDADRHVGDHLLEQLALRVVGAGGAGAGEVAKLEFQIGDFALPAEIGGRK